MSMSNEFILGTEIRISEKEESEFEEFLHNRIRDFNNENSIPFLEARKPGTKVPLNIILRDRESNLLGGISAATYWGWLDIDDFYLVEEIRGQGIGAQLLEKAETIAASRGCTRCILSTYEFQARVFYEKQAYRVVGTLEDYPPGSAYYWMRKDLQLADPKKGSVG